MGSIPFAGLMLLLLAQVHVPDAPRGQTQMSEFGAEKGLLQGHARGRVARALKSPRAPRRVSAKPFVRAR